MKIINKKKKNSKSETSLPEVDNIENNDVLQSSIEESVFNDVNNMDKNISSDISKDSKDLKEKNNINNLNLVKDSNVDKNDDKKTSKKSLLKFGKYQKKEQSDKKINLPILNNLTNSEDKTIVENNDVDLSHNEESNIKTEVQNLDLEIKPNDEVKTLEGFSEDDEVKKIRDLSVKTLEKTLNTNKDKAFFLGTKRKVSTIDYKDDVLKTEDVEKNDNKVFAENKTTILTKQEKQTENLEHGDKKLIFVASDTKDLEDFAETFDSPIDIEANFHQSIDLKVKEQKQEQNSGLDKRIRELLKNITEEQKMAIIHEYENEEAKILDAFELANHENNDDFYAQKNSEEEYEKWMMKNNQPE